MERRLLLDGDTTCDNVIVWSLHPESGRFLWSCLLAKMSSMVAPPRHRTAVKTATCLAVCLRNKFTVPTQHTRPGQPRVGVRCKAKMKAAAFVGKQLLRVPARQANILHGHRTDEQLQACSIGRRSMTALLQSKAEESGSLCWQEAAPASAGQTGQQFASATH